MTPTEKYDKINKKFQTFLTENKVKWKPTFFRSSRFNPCRQEHKDLTKIFYARLSTQEKQLVVLQPCCLY